MIKYLLYIVFAAFSFLTLSFACGCSESGDASQNVWCEYSSLEVSPSDSLEVGLFGQEDYVITVRDPYGHPMIDAPVFIDFVGSAHNASVTLCQGECDEETSLPYYGFLYTNGAGEVAILFTAPDTEAQFSIRFSSPVVEGNGVSVDVTVNPDALSTLLNVDYLGNREIDTVKAELFEEVSCDDLVMYEESVPMDTVIIEQLPGDVSFSGLKNNYKYSVRLRGLNSAQDTRAYECISNIEPNETNDSVLLQDVLLNVSGSFSSLCHVATNGILDPAVEEIKAAINQSNTVEESSFVTDSSESILSSIREIVVEMDPLDGVPFDEICETNDLYTKLNKLFIQNSVSVDEALAPVWQKVKDYLASTAFAGSIEIGSPSKGVYPVSHRIDGFGFDGDVSEAGVYFSTSMSESCSCTIQASTSDPDVFHLDPHYIFIGLGDIIYDLVTQYGLQEAYQTSDLSDALYGIVDCEEVAAHLAPWLSEVATGSIIEAGCKLATEYTEEKLVVGRDELNMKYGAMVIEGSFSSVVPSQTDQISELTSGVLSITWSGESSEGLGPMEATLEADLNSDF